MSKPKSRMRTSSSMMGSKVGGGGDPKGSHLYLLRTC